MRVDRTVMGSVTDSQIIIGNHNKVITAVSLKQPKIRVPQPWRRAGAERMLFGAGDHHAAGRPLTWLRPDAGVLPVQPRSEDDDLLSWCIDGSQLRVRLVCGRGGQGKTTTALQLVRALRQRGWLAGFVDLAAAHSDGSGSESARRRWAELETALTSRPVRRSPTLLVVDYAENEPLSLRRLLTVVQGTASVRVLLLSRTEGNWWPELLADPVWSTLIDIEPVRLDSLTTRLAGDRLTEVYTEAMRCFEARLHGASLPPQVVAEKVMPAQGFATTLDLYADALLRVLDAAAVARGEQPVRSTTGGDPISDLLAHESRHVRSVLADHKVELSSHDRNLVLAAPFLMPAPTLDDAVRLLYALGLEGQHDESVLRRVATVLGKLYPDERVGKEAAHAVGVWAAPRPDRLPDSHLLGLADRAISDQDWDHLVLRLCGTDDGELAEHVTQVLLRCLSTPGAERRFPVGLKRITAGLDSLVRTYAKGYVLPIMLLRPGSFTDAIGAALTDEGPSSLRTADVDALDGVLLQLGFSMRRTADVVHVSRRLVRDTTPQPDADETALHRHATELSQLAIRLAQVGQRQQALAHAQRATDIRERLAETNPDTYLPDLALSLNNLASYLTEAGQRELALDHARRAVDIRERLAETNPDAYLPNLAASVTNLANHLAQMGQRQQALDHAQRAAGLYQRLAETNLDAHLPNLAISLNNLAIRLAEMGRLEEALSHAVRAVDIRERLAETNPDAHLPDLAMSLDNLAIRLAEMGRLEEALDCAQRAVDLYQRLAEINPDAYLPDLAGALNNLTNELARVGRLEEALSHAVRAVDIRERLAETDPDADLPGLAMSLDNLAIRLAQVGQLEEALDCAQRAVDLYQRLAEINPDAYLPDLAGALNNLANHLTEVGQHGQALDYAQRTADLYQRLAEINPDAYLPDLAMSLNNLAISLTWTRQREQALDYAQRAVDIRERLAGTNPGAYLPDLASSLNILAGSLARVGQGEQALDCAQRAVDIRERLAETNPDAYLPDLAISLNNLAVWLRDLGRRADGEFFFQRANEIRNALDNR